MELKGKTAAYITLGCKLNFSETSTIRHSLEKAGISTVDEHNGADIFVINTCSVTDMAERKGRQLIRKIIHHNPDAYVVVVGCYAQLRAKELMKIEGVNLVLGVKDKFHVDQYLQHLAAREHIEPHSCNVFKVDEFDLACSYGDRTRCFLKVQDGCDYFCSYCTIPYARGKSRSATIAQIVEAVQNVAAKDIHEIILTGVNTGDFGRDTDENMLRLIETLDKMKEIDRFRISSIEPNLLTDDIITYIAESERFMPHFHIPLQAGSNEVLQLMKRRYPRELFAEKINIIRRLSPDAFIGVDVIAGMRGETNEYFEDSKTFIETLDISRLHVFPYSERSGTRALDISFTVSQTEKHRRVNELIHISDKKLSKFTSRFIGQTRPVLFEASNNSGIISGFTDNYLRVGLPYDENLVNKIVDINISTENLLLDAGE